MGDTLPPLSSTTDGDTSEGAIGYDPKGYPAYVDFVDLYGSHVRAQLSSRAFHPACWLWIKATQASAAGVEEDGAGHLTLPQAIARRDGLNAFIAQSTAEIENGSYWAEADQP